MPELKGVDAFRQMLQCDRKHAEFILSVLFLLLN